MQIGSVVTFNYLPHTYKHMVSGRFNTKVKSMSFKHVGTKSSNCIIFKIGKHIKCEMCNFIRNSI